MSAVIVVLDEDGYIVNAFEKPEKTVLDQLGEAKDARGVVKAIRSFNVKGLGSYYTDTNIAQALLLRSKDRLSEEEFRRFDELITKLNPLDRIAFETESLLAALTIPQVLDGLGDNARLPKIVQFFIDP